MTTEKYIKYMYRDIQKIFASCSLQKSFINVIETKMRNSLFFFQINGKRKNMKSYNDTKNYLYWKWEKHIKEKIIYTK